MDAKVVTVIFHGVAISENVTRVMVYICTKFMLLHINPQFCHISTALHGK